ncbi:N-alpha-acetyltransferase 38, NatC auxiliary subunit [Myiozetetes cayanensis]|uniref:N-alpha-acetyltransferase 38, NatC auxiliary subunit n=1 Tax=Myiozetetes cayanensis TaxID=478635 RepID=UPI00215DF6D3|nr:N-alpha-acetyltransferase 38, NatC auxiliary subunit [Myiozetetes cayanensis]
MAEPPVEAGGGGGGDPAVSEAWGSGVSGVRGARAGSRALERQRLEALLNRSLRIRMSDGRTLVGAFLCTDRQSNVILGSAQEFLKAADAFPGSEPRVLGLAMVPGHHIVSIEVEPPYP